MNISRRQTAENTDPMKRNNMKQYSLLVRVPRNYGAQEARKAAPQWDQLIEKWKQKAYTSLVSPFQERALPPQAFQGH